MLTSDFTKPEKGLFIVVDGPDGAGKTSIVKFIQEYLDQHGISNESLQAIGAGTFGQSCRNQVVNHSQDLTTEVSILAAAHVVAYNDEICPRLKRGRSVVMDRWISSFYAYQAYGRESALAKKLFELLFVENDNFKEWPDLYFVCNVSPAVSELRLKQRPEINNHFDNERMVFKRRVALGYENFVLRYFNRVQTIDCDFSFDHVKKVVKRHLDDLLAYKSIKPLEGK